MERKLLIRPWARAFAKVSIRKGQGDVSDKVIGFQSLGTDIEAQ